jgi:phosphoribosylaminoimidazolecarboxamide formyltransferase / IMP cyclohydrolase
MSSIRISRAFLSVSDKTGLTDLAKALVRHGAKLVSTGGTAKALRDAGLEVQDVSDLTGFPEMMDGRVKTLHPKVHGGILAVRNERSHTDAMKAHGIAPIDLVVVNLYPFEETVARSAPFDETIENIDIGGPAMIRSAAKNHAFVAVLTDPADYAGLISALDSGGGATTLDQRKAWAAKAFARTASYDAAISGWFAKTLGDFAPARKILAGKLQETLRYGENPHQTAAFYLTGEKRAGIATARQVQGKELSYNNLNDTDAAYEAVAEFAGEGPVVVIVKHANPCGVARGKTLAEAYARALATDPVSAFGGIIALNGAIDGETATAISQIFTEVIIAPDASAEALDVLGKKKNLRVLLAGALPDATAPGEAIRTVAGGFLLQSRDNARLTEKDLKVVTKRAPTKAELADMLFAFRVAKHVKSNAIVYVKDLATVGIGAGQMSRVDSSRIAARKAEDAASAAGLKEPLTRGSVVASDAFFPFADGLLAAAEAGATAVIQPGGSIRDDDVIKAADEAGLAMVFTGVRHFRH